MSGTVIGLIAARVTLSITETPKNFLFQESCVKQSILMHVACVDRLFQRLGGILIWRHCKGRGDLVCSFGEKSGGSVMVEKGIGVQGSCQFLFGGWANVKLT